MYLVFIKEAKVGQPLSRKAMARLYITKCGKGIQLCKVMGGDKEAENQIMEAIQYITSCIQPEDSSNSNGEIFAVLQTLIKALEKATGNVTEGVPRTHHVCSAWWVINACRAR